MTVSFIIPTPDDIRKKTEAVFKRCPCDFQVEAALTLLQCEYVILVAPTGSGKTLPLWIPSLFNNSGITVTITALNILGEQNKNELKVVGIKAVSVTTSNASADLYKDITACKYHIVIIPPEHAKPNAQFQKILLTKSFIAKLFNICY
ncbi:hypothetical protein M422DRAFT_270587 [Sphaerobolus stellatus SS14]|uniref:DEAD/DEAH-box helicase domain-containing protein n=1 Tax=Sphaerobolus stellatus (strain SS14) TaxID=990650 RepID=A0A0C9U236_SPHS4|nr:hypothetical protein M422DRAFT_270587 [Sphaerobolus stellatus SS14]